MGIQLLQAGIQLSSLESNFSLSWIPGIQLSKSYWEHCTYFNQVSLKWNITVLFWGPQALGIDGERVSIFSTDVLVDGLLWSFDRFLNGKTPMPAVSSPLWI